VADVRESTGFDYDVSPSVRETEPPSAEDLKLLRGKVRQVIGADYPEFARRVWAAGAIDTLGA
jgi:hypothetical protein